MDKFNATDINKLGDYPKVFSELLDTFQVSNEASAKQKIRKLMIDLDLEVKFSMFNITTNDIPLILDNINYERLQNNPRKISRNELKNILISLI